MQPSVPANGARIAPLGDRAIAAIVDLILMWAPFAVIGMWTATRFGGVTSNGFQLDGAPGLLTITLTAAVAFLYIWLAEGIFGTTLGKLAMNLRVRTAGGARIGLGRSFARNALRIVDGIGVYLVGLIVALTSPARQRLGDRVAGTLVVQTDGAVATRVTGAAAFVVVLAACVTGAVALHAGAPAAAQVAPQITQAVLGTGRTDDGAIIGQATSFPGNTAAIVCVWRDAGVSNDVAIRSVWVATTVDGVAPNTTIAEKSISGTDSGTFTLSGPSTGVWPAGSYRLDLYIGDALVKSLPYTITKS
jgi:uncharacterized RDD family membrane protein YckC